MKTKRAARLLNVAERVVGHIGLGLDYAQLQDPLVVTSRLIDAGERLKTLGASAIVLAGAGLARYVAPLQQTTGLNVIDPTQAACALALGQVLQLRYSDLPSS